jgi:hypothetical protein
MGHGLDDVEADVEGVEAEVVLKKAMARDRGRGSPLRKRKAVRENVRPCSFVWWRWLRIGCRSVNGMIK